MKKLIACALALALLCVPLSACGGQDPGPSGSGTVQVPPEELDGITHRLFADWYAYAARCEYLYGDMLWALSYLEPFFEDHSWDSLQTARAALYLAELRANLIDPPETAQMSFDDYDTLIQSGADVGPVQTAFDGISSLQNSLLIDYRLYRDGLNSPVDSFFLTYQLAHFENWAGLIRQIYELHLQSCAIETDYVLLAVDNEGEEARLIDAIATNCPQINARRANNPKDQDALLKEQGVLLDELERLTSELSTVVGQSQASLDLFQDALQFDVPDGSDALSQYAASMAADAVELTGFPMALPYPSWWYEKQDQTMLYMWEDSPNGGTASVMPGDAIETPPDQYYIKWPGVPLDQYNAYLDTLEGYGIPAQFVTEKEGVYTAFFELQTGSLTLIWEEDAVTFFTMEGSVCFAPPWYVLYTSQAPS